MYQEIRTTTEPTPEILEWASTLSIVLSFIDVAIANLNLETGKGAIAYFQDRASRAAAVLPILNINPIEVSKMDADAKVFQAFYELCRLRAEQAKITIAAAAQSNTIDQLRASFGL